MSKLNSSTVSDLLDELKYTTFIIDDGGYGSMESNVFTLLIMKLGELRHRLVLNSKEKQLFRKTVGIIVNGFQIYRYDAFNLLDEIIIDVLIVCNLIISMWECQAYLMRF